MNPIRPMYLLHSRSGYLSVFQLFVLPLNFDIVVVLVKLSGITFVMNMRGCWQNR